MALVRKFERSTITTWGCSEADCPWEMDAPTEHGRETPPPEVQREYSKHRCKTDPNEVKW